VHQSRCTSDLSHELGRLQSHWDRNVCFQLDRFCPQIHNLLRVIQTPAPQPRQLVDLNGVPNALHPTALHQVMQTQAMPETLVSHTVPSFAYQMYPLDRPMTTPWPPTAIPPQHLTHMIPRDDGWTAVYAQAQPAHSLQPADYDYTRYRDPQNGWAVPVPNDYYNQAASSITHTVIKLLTVLSSV
jgi:hypothetical protein